MFNCLQPGIFYTFTITLNVDLMFLTFIYAKHVWGYSIQVIDSGQYV